MLQLDVNKHPSGTVVHSGARATLVDLQTGEHGILDGLDLPEEDARRLMELGFIPGSRVTAGLSAPGGDPRVFRVDGSEVALRRETAARLTVRSNPGGTAERES